MTPVDTPWRLLAPVVTVWRPLSPKAKILKRVVTHSVSYHVIVHLINNVSQLVCLFCFFGVRVLWDNLKARHVITSNAYYHAVLLMIQNAIFRCY